MTIILIALACIAWLACSVAAYLLYRRLIRWKVGRWTAFDRNVAMGLSAAGPMALVAAVLLWLELTGDDRPAKW